MGRAHREGHAGQTGSDTPDRTAAGRRLRHHVGKSDPFAHLGAWARIDGRTLRIDILGLRRDGKLERQVYERTLQDGDMMLLTYRRFVEDELAKTIEADFMRL